MMKHETIPRRCRLATAGAVLASAIVLVVLVLVGTVRAEKANLGPEQLRKTATDVIVGEVTAIYERQASEGNWKYRHYVAEIRVERVEKGEELEAGDLAYVRYWQRSWSGWTKMPPSTAGHRGCPGAGDRVRVYLARNAYDGFTKDNTDGGFNVIGANGFEPVTD